MTDAQLFLWLGVTLFAVGVGMLTSKNFIKDLLKEFQNSTASVFYGGLACLAIGLPMVTFHNVWSMNVTVIITIISWVTLIKGLMLVMFPTFTTELYKGVLVKESKATISYCVLLVGIILLGLAFFA